MGVINDGTAKGLVPNTTAYAVHYPGYPSSISRAIHTLGGSEAIIKAHSSPSNKLDLYFRPEDPYSHPTSGELRPCNNLLLKISNKKHGLLLHDSINKSDIEEKVDTVTNLSVSIIARITEAYYFEGMADYQHVVAVHANAAQKERRNWEETDPHFHATKMKAGFMEEDLMILLPPLFSPKDKPENLVLRLPTTSASKKKQEDALGNQEEVNIEPALAIDFSIKDILSSYLRVLGLFLDS